MSSHRIQLCEVGPRDGLQNESMFVPTDLKLQWIEQLVSAGLTMIEATSFVSPQKVPQMADHEAVCRALSPRKEIYPVLVPNTQGFERALACGASHIAVFGSPSESFVAHNIHCSVEESLQRFESVTRMARERNIQVRGYVSCVLGCPYEGDISLDAVCRYVERLWSMGCSEISLGDTIGVGTPQKAREVVKAVSQQIPLSAIALHFHDTYGQALANVYACLELGVRTFDASVAGLGGCPYAPGASGNVATEDLVYLLHGLGFETGVDLDALIQAGRWMCAYLKKDNRSKVSQAWKSA